MVVVDSSVVLQRVDFWVVLLAVVARTYFWMFYTPFSSCPWLEFQSVLWWVRWSKLQGKKPSGINPHSVKRDTWVQIDSVFKKLNFQTNTLVIGENGHFGPTYAKFSLAFSLEKFAIQILADQKSFSGKRHSSDASFDSFSRNISYKQVKILCHFLQFRLAYVAPESRVAGSGDLVDDPKLIARNYFRGCFAVDFFIVLPLPQASSLILIIILVVLPGSIGANYAKNLLRAAILIQYIPRLWRFLPLVTGPSPTGFIFESAWANFVINLLTFVLASHVVGSCWYLFGLQRVNQCFRDACSNSNITDCTEFIDCGHGNANERFTDSRGDWDMWKNNENASAAVNITTHRSLVKRYVYSLFWGFQVSLCDTTMLYLY
ncbi:probable cyclic nucleotide-gated ion channel 20, chloroplastic [Salvia splendens]|uniref:probable cyclic nucleotide-gated ion channel 20, chloroplastic n=1 Tax=Salvia splendens TaxID=180675 RepID=UPI001C265C8B|nr:probable cyclic nucleotide-gated ion channel 20, chloroplastic [Salvia splendens]